MDIESDLGIFAVEVPFYLFVIFLQSFLAFSFGFRFAVHRLVLFSFSGHSFPFSDGFPIVLLFDGGIENFPHLSDLFSDLCDSVAGELVFDLGVDVHPVEEECAHGFFGGFWFVVVFARHVGIWVGREGCVLISDTLCL
jgi:hypothetical protein